MSDDNIIEPMATTTRRSIQVLSMKMRIQDVSIERPAVVAYFNAIPADKQEIALVHALEVGVAELAARRARAKSAQIHPFVPHPSSADATCTARRAAASRGGIIQPHDDRCPFPVGRSGRQLRLRRRQGRHGRRRSRRLRRRAHVGGRAASPSSGADGRFTVETPAAGSVTLIVRAPRLRREAAGRGGRRRRQRHGRARAGDAPRRRHRHADAHRAAAGRRRRRASTCSTREDIRQSPAVVADDVLRQMPTFSLFRRTSSLVVASDDAGRVAARHRAERRQPHARAARRRAVQRSVRRLGVLDARAARRRRAHRGRRRPELEPVRQLRDGRRHQHRHAPAAAADASSSSRSTATTSSPKLDFFGSDVWGKVGVVVDGSVFDTDGFPIVVDERARRRSTTTPTVKFRNVNVKARLQPDRPRATRSSGPATSARSATTARSARSTAPRRRTTRAGRPSAAASALVLPDESDLQASVFGDVETFHSNFLAVPAAATPPRSVGRHDAQSERADQRRRRHGAVVEAVRRAAAASAPAPTGAGWTATARKTRSTPADAATHGRRCSACRAARSAASASFVQDIITPAPKLTVTLSARVDHWRNYDAHNLETNVPSRHADRRTTRRRCPDRDDTVVSPRVAALYHVDRSRQRLGRRRRRLPRADAQRAVPPVPRRHGADAGQRPARPRAAGRRRSSASTSRRART